MIAGAERAEMIEIVAAIQLRMLGDDRLVADLELLPDADLPLRRLAPRAFVVPAAVVGAARAESLAQSPGESSASYPADCLP